jgi:hypothetical protein
MDERMKSHKNIINKTMMALMSFLRWATRCTFTFNGKKYNYFHHMYHLTFKNERAVEIPIVYEIVKNCNGRILEVGNTLSYYFKVSHDIVDKYDKGDGVINEDIVDFKPTRKYDLIVCISTLEHIGMDESAISELNKLDSTKTLRAIEKFKSILAVGGKAVVTFPLCYNSYLDKLFKRGKIHFTKTYYMKRISWDNRWIETKFEDVRDSKFGEQYKFANALVIGIIEK